MPKARLKESTFVFPILPYLLPVFNPYHSFILWLII